VNSVIAASDCLLRVSRPSVTLRRTVSLFYDAVSALANCRPSGAGAKRPTVSWDLNNTDDVDEPRPLRVLYTVV